MPSKGWLRFRDLKARNIVKNWPNLKRKVKYQGFPPGRMTGPNERSWTEEEIDAYREGCPVEGPEPRGAAKKNRDRKAASAPPLPKVETGESRPSWRHAPPDETDLDQQGGGPGLSTGGRPTEM